MKYVISFLLAFFAISGIVSAQAGDHAWLETSQLKVRINADGRLFCDDDKGAFLVPHNDTFTTLMRGAGLWMGGFDPGNNLYVSSQTENPAQNDFIAGFHGIPNSGKVWKVTRDEIIAHLQDYQEDLDIDHPIPSIFSWPAAGNPYFYQYNGFELPDSMATFGFLEIDPIFSKINFDPQNGDYPILDKILLNYDWRIPSELAVFAFHTNPDAQGGSSNRKFRAQFWVQVFVFDCPENALLPRSVFVDYRWKILQGELMDSSVVTAYVNPDIGNPTDDYHGCLPGKWLYFAYNADNSDDIWGENSPVLLVQTVKPPLEFIIQDEVFAEFYASPSLMPCGCTPGTCLYPMTYPTSRYETYNYQTGSWQNGAPLMAYGNGYNHGLMLPRVQNAFPGYPDEPGAWTEINAQNTPGDRKGLINYFTNRVYPHLINHMTLMYSYTTYTESGVTNGIQNWTAAFNDNFDGIICCKETPIGTCSYPIFSYTHPAPLTVFPNPADDVIRVWHPERYIRSMQLYNALGHLVGIGQYRGRYSEISVAELSAGIYFLHVETEHGEKQTTKVMVAHGSR